MASVDEVLRRWASVASWLEWDSPWDVLWEGDQLPGRWFVGGQLNVAANCLDRHLAGGADRVALRWEGEPGDRRSIRYGELHAEACAFARALKSLGVGTGDRVALYLGWVPELVVAMLGCARLGAVVTVTPASLPAVALAERLARFKPRMLITQDGGWRHGVVLPLKTRADEALAAAGEVEHLVVVRRTGMDVGWYEGDRWYHDLLADAGDTGDDRPIPLPADHPLLIHYLPAPEGLREVVHRAAGVLVHAVALHRLVLAPRADDVLLSAWEVAGPVGTTHSMLGPLACGATTVVYEGMLDTPTTDRAWQLLERYGVTSVLTSPSVVSNLRRWWGDEPPTAALRAVRQVITGGEPLADRDRQWLTSLAGDREFSVFDCWGQTELGGIVAFRPAPEGIDELPDPGLDIVDREGRPVSAGESGELVLRHPWPATSVPDAEAATKRYWLSSPAGVLYRSGDLARRETDGTITILERLEPMVKVSGQLVSVASMADILGQHPLVDAVEVMQVPDREGGRLLVAWVVLGPDASPSAEVALELKHDLHDMLGGLSVPHTVAFVEAFPPDITAADRRHALRTLAAEDHGSIREVTTDQLRAATRLPGATTRTMRQA
jgi:acetyl-CoA synthetase